MRAARLAVAAARREFFGRIASAEIADDAGGDDDRRKGQAQREDGDERGDRDRPQPGVLQRARADAVRGRDHDGDHRRLDAVEHAGDHRHVAPGEVDPRERDEDVHRGQHEQPAGDDAAPGAVHHPADVGGELRRLGAGQHHAVVERVQETAFRDPAPALDQLLVHDRDLPGRAAEADEAELEPEAERLAKAHRVACSLSGRVHGSPFQVVLQSLDGMPSWDCPGACDPDAERSLAYALISRAVIVYLKLSGSRLSRRSLPYSPCGYMRKPTLPLAEPGSLMSAASLKATQFISQAPKRLRRTGGTSGSARGVGCARASSTTLRTAAGSTGTQP